MSDEFEIHTDTEGIRFVANRETGKWILTNDRVGAVKEKLSLHFSKPTLEGAKMIVLNMGRACNFRCVYCSVGDKKEEIGQLTEEVGMKTMERVSEMKQDKKEIVFHGSEPMMNYDLIKDLVSYGHSLDPKIQFCMQSNGSLLTPEKIGVLKQLEVGLGISLDGLEHHQNSLRPLKDGGKSYESVIKNIEEVKKQQGGISTISVITSENVGDLEEIVEDFERKGIKEVSFNPVSSLGNLSLVPEEGKLIENVKKVLDKYLSRMVAGEDPIRIETLRRYTGMIFRPKINSNCAQCGTGPSNPLLAVDIDGTVYPCDYFWGNQEFKMGNIFNDSLDDLASGDTNFRNCRKVSEVEECSPCDWKTFCGSGCPGSASDLSLKGEHCEYNRAMLTYAAKKIPLIHSKKLIKKVLYVK